MEILKETIIIKRPEILDNQERCFKDWGKYQEEYVNVLDNQICKLFSNAYRYFCKKENKLVGRESLLGHKETIKSTKTQYIYDFWNMENIEEFSFGFHSTKGEIIGRLIVNIKLV